MRKLIIVFCLLSVSFLYGAEIISKTGKLISNGKNWFLKSADGFYILNIAPEEWLEEKEITLEPNSSVKVTGKLEEKEFLVNVLFAGKQIVVMRDGQGTPLWAPSIKLTHFVQPAKCIGCRLCVSICPVDAIKMYKGKAIIDADKCINCKICMDGNDKFKGCPTSAIRQIENDQ